MRSRIRNSAERYLRSGYTQHREGASEFGPGREGLIRMFRQIPTMPPPAGAAKAPPASTVLAFVAQGGAARTSLIARDRRTGI
jgi:hypothetical protein